MKNITLKMIKLLSIVLLTTCLTVTSVSAQEDKPKITVTTTFLSDIVNRIAPNTFEVVSIVPAGGDPHIYTASAGDLMNITEADLVLFHGLHFEAQMAEVLEQTDNAKSVTEAFDPEDLIYVSEDSDEVDPHYWFDIDLYKNSVEQAQKIMIEAFPEYSELIKEHTTAYLDELDELDQWITTEINQLNPKDRILVTPHDAFTYFARRYDFTVYSPQGISTESEVSNDAIIQTVNFIVEHQVPAIFLDTTSNPQAMSKLQEGVNQLGQSVELISGEDAELYSDSLAAQGKDNDNYIDMYRHNVSVIVNNLLK
ncbi:metal ABC transporter solute-binding protein, Zn/Mn family [Aerococcaceae bacterium WGS1372]